MAEEAPQAASVGFESVIESVSCDHMHMSNHSCIANQTSLHSPWLILANPVSAQHPEYWMIFLLIPLWSQTLAVVQLL